MAAYIGFQPSDFFNTKLYTGTGSELTVSGVGFQPDLTWLKNRSAAQHYQLYDAVRGAGKVIYSNLNNIQGTVTQNLKSFTSDGYVLGTDGSVNTNNQNFVSWNWKAGTTSGISGGTITPSAYSINTTSGFGIYNYAGTGSNGTIAHGLSSAPKMVICKRIAGDTGDWNSWNEGMTSGSYYINLNTNGAEVSNTAVWNSTIPSSTVVSLGTYAAVNASGSTYIMYAFSEVKGFSSMGVYTGNGNVNGSFIYTGFKPAFVSLKKTDGSGDWYTYDDKRLGYNADNNALYLDLDNAESTSEDIDILSNGFKLRSTNGEINGSGGKYIYMAWAEQPIVSSNSKAGTAR